MATNAPHTVILKGTPLYKEGNATSQVKPGLLIEASGESVAPHATAGGTAAPAFVVERGWLGETIEMEIASGERTPYAVCQPGIEVYALLAPEANAAAGDFLTSNGDGNLRPVNDAAETAEVPVAKAVEAVNNSAGEAHVRIKVEVI